LFSPIVRLFHPHDPHLITETFYFSDFFKRAATFGETVTNGVQPYFREAVIFGGGGGVLSGFYSKFLAVDSFSQLGQGHRLDKSHALFTHRELFPTVSVKQQITITLPLCVKPEI